MALTLTDELVGLLEPLAGEHGLELVTVEVAGAQRGQTVRVFLDSDGGIDIDTISAANEWIADALEGVTRLNSAYTLEVSSPGIERALRRRSDFVRFEGRLAVIRTSSKIAGRAGFTGVLRGMEGEDVIIEADDVLRRVPFDSIERAHLKFDFDNLAEGE